MIMQGTKILIIFTSKCTKSAFSIYEPKFSGAKNGTNKINNFDFKHDSEMDIDSSCIFL